MKRPPAFSLVEVALALGVTSFALMSMLGVMSVGLTTVKDASDQTMHAQILAQMSAAVSQIPFDDIEGFSEQSPFFFDQTGRKVAPTAAMYRVRLQAEVGASYPDSPADLANAARTVRIEISTVPGGSGEPTATASASVLVPRS